MKINAEIGAQILAMARQGRSERAIVTALGAGAPSRATVRRYIDRMAAERREAAPPKPAPADLVQEHQIDGVLQRVVMVGGAGLCSSCSALERLERERRREPEDAPRTRSRDRVA